MYYVYDLASGKNVFADTEVDAYVKATRLLIERMPHLLQYPHIGRATIDMHLVIGKATVVLKDAEDKPTAVLAPVWIGG